MAAHASLKWMHGDEEEARRTRRDAIRDDEVSEPRRRSLSRRMRNRSVDPAVALPIQYRSVSFDVDEAQRVEQRAKSGDETRDAIVSKFESMDWHTLSIVEVQKRLGVDAISGLSEADAKSRAQTHGMNRISSSSSPFRMISNIFAYFFKGFGSILFVGSILVFISWKPLGQPPAVANLALGIVLFATFLIQAAFSAWQDYSSSRVMATINAMLPESCHLIRQGLRTKVDAPYIVPGDVVLIKAGNRIPADVRFVDVSHDTTIDRAVLTGESKPIKATVDTMDLNYLQAENIGLQGTHCVSGSAVGIVVSTGDSTVFGQIARLTGQPKTGLTTIEKEILRFVLLIVVIMVIWVIILTAVWGGWLRKKHPDWINVPTLIVDIVSVCVAFIPEGLPSAISASLTITANLIRKHRILCKSLKTVETLGAVSVICSDKTGTLTRNKMFATDFSLGTHTYPAEAGASVKDASPGAQQVRAIAGLCNAAEFDAESMSLPLSERRIFGDATDQAALRLSESLGSVAALRDACKPVFDLAFNSKNKFMAKVFTITGTQGRDICLSHAEAADYHASRLLITVKGAPDVLIERCTSLVLPDGTKAPLTSQLRSDILTTKDGWSSNGKRVILLARKLLSDDKILPRPDSADFEMKMMSELEGDLTLVGLVAIIDLPRKEIPDVVDTLNGAGIRVFMVTGDFGLTALAIARQCRIVTRDAVCNISHLDRFPPQRSVGSHALPRPRPDAAILLNGTDLMTLNDYQWDQLSRFGQIVFARTTPDQKLRIVRELQARGEVVGMTGDGVNDAPALKAADIGISLASGSDIAIEAADMVLLDSFAAIVEAVRYGRLVFDNLKKVTAYLLPAGSWSEFWPVFANVVFGIPQILSSFLMIIICCFTDCIGAVALAYEVAEADVLLRPPRNVKKTRLVNWQLMFHAYAFTGMIETTLSFTMAFWYLQRNGIPFSDLWFKFGDLPPNIDPDYYASKLNVASSIYFINLVVMQWFNLMGVRTRRLSIFQHPPLFNKQTQNILLFPAIILTLGIAVIWLYIPKLQTTLGTAGPPAEYYFYPAALGLGLLCLDEARKAYARRYPKSILAKMAW